ncbi:MAG: hypothetical protein EPN86_05500 [Nanoarchaeota archaeon]|nr:MAG: hypothetical protein EPN86_05500 [Nanoarchaeota archaeon]
MVFDPMLHLFIQAGKVQGDELAGLTRFIIWIVLFAVIYGALRAINQPWLSNNVSLVVALGLATLSAVFMPDWAIAQIGSSYGQIAFVIFLLPIVGLILWIAISKWNQPLASTPAWFLLLVLVSYFNQVISVARPSDNKLPLTPGMSIESVTGIMHPIFQVLGAIVAIAFVVSAIRLLTSLPGMFGGGGQGAGGGGFNLGNLNPFNWGQGNQPAGGGPPVPQVPAPPGPAQPQVQQQQQQLQQQINDIVQQMNQLQGQIQQMQQAWGNPGQQVMTGQQITWLTAAITQLINLQQQYITLQNQINATP